jgi:hypothetical protein
MKVKLVQKRSNTTCVCGQGNYVAQFMLNTCVGSKPKCASSMRGDRTVCSKMNHLHTIEWSVGVCFD